MARLFYWNNVFFKSFYLPVAPFKIKKNKQGKVKAVWRNYSAISIRFNGCIAYKYIIKCFKYFKYVGLHNLYVYNFNFILYV